MDGDLESHVIDLMRTCPHLHVIQTRHVERDDGGVFVPGGPFYYLCAECLECMDVEVFE